MARRLASKSALAAGGAAAVVALASPAFAQQASGSIELPTIQVVSTAPAPAPTAGVAAANVPAGVEIVSQDQIRRTNSPNIEDALQRSAPGVITSGQAGSPFQLDLEYRGFLASPVSGTPQGLAVYQNGVRVNEAFGDIVNWDFLPPMAIRSVNVYPDNPAFGLNALGGAVNVTMKNGFTDPGGAFDVHGGSFGRLDTSLQYGKQVGRYATYFALEGLHEDGWRQFSPTTLRRGYFDLGYKGDEVETHLSFTGADNDLGADGSTPAQLLSNNYAAVYTTPQTSVNKLAFLNLQGAFTPSPTLSVQSNVYFRHYNQFHVDGNTTDAQPCDPNVAPGLLCFGDGVTPAVGLNGQQLPDLSNGQPLGEIDRTWINTNGAGAAVQATDAAKLAGHGNDLVVGASLDRGWTQFRGDSELGIIQPDLVVTGLGQYLDQPAGSGGVAPVAVRATNTYVGAYALDTFDVTPRFSLTGGGRFNFAAIDLLDELGGGATGDNNFSRLNPVISGSYRLTPDVTAFVGYSEANRAPTPLELGCANPVQPCILQNFLISDPPLKQVVARTIAGGLRGGRALPSGWGRIDWSLSGFRTENSDDILNVPSAISGFGYFQNVGTTLRQGLEAAIHYQRRRWDAYASYSLVDATFQTPLVLSSPDNPYADANGDIFVSKGDRVPGIPLNRLKLGVDYALTERWRIGSDVILASGQYLVGDESNQNPQLPGYAVVNARTSYQVTKNVQIYGMIDNLLDRRYSTYGTFFQTDAIPFLALSDPRSLSPAAPFAAYGGLRATF